MKRLEGKRAIVTGGAAGIGKAIVQQFVGEGAKVIIADIDFTTAELLAKELQPNAKPFKLNVTSSDNFKSLVEFCENEFNGLDIFVNNAGIGLAGKLEDTNEEDWQRIIDVNLKGTFLGMKYGIPLLKKSGGGAVINISSIAALVGLVDRAVYSAAKGGIMAMTRAAAIDYVNDNIRINCIAPGTVDTPWIERITNTYADPAAAKKGMMERQPHGRLVSPDEIAAMAVYLASDESKSTIGAVMVVDGGMTAR
ncbi:MAG: glucose 1-dehydrogenase [Ignavibacteriales bacterium]|nr:MAG: glucose 1-dehydrogenase [Ignavibacteriales bacterium]